MPLLTYRFTGTSRISFQVYRSLSIRNRSLYRSQLISSLETNFPVTILMTFASEGDNRGDALRLVEYYNQWAQLVNTVGVTDGDSL